MREGVEEKLEESSRKVSLLQDRLVECTRIPELETKLRQTKDETQRLTKEVEDLEVGRCFLLLKSLLVTFCTNPWSS